MVAREDAQTGLTGGCQCGAVRYRLAKAPSRANVCHCRMCQKAVGGPFKAWANVRIQDLAWTRGTPTVFHSSSAAQRWTLHAFTPAPDYAGAIAYQDRERPLTVNPLATVDQLLDRL